MELLKKIINKLDRREYVGNFHVSVHKIDLINIWKVKGINYLLDLKAKNTLHHIFIHYWTPAWHEGRGPYISIQIGRLRFMRGY